MNTIFHLAMSYVWATLLVLGALFSGATWLLMAAWDGMKRAMGKSDQGQR